MDCFEEVELGGVVNESAEKVFLYRERFSGAEDGGRCSNSVGVVLKGFDKFPFVVRVLDEL
jgi:hypothetical protein